MLVDAFSTVYLPLPRMAAECITQVMQVGEHIEYYVDVSVQQKYGMLSLAQSCSDVLQCFYHDISKLEQKTK